MNDELRKDTRPQRPEAYARLLQSRQAEDKTLEEIQREIDRDDEARRVRDATARHVSGRGDDLERLRGNVYGRGPHSLSEAYIFNVLKKEYPQEHWNMVIERDREIYAERRRRAEGSDD